MFVQSDGAPQINEGLEVTDKDKLGSGWKQHSRGCRRSSAQLIVGAHRPREASTGGSLTPVTALKSSIVLSNPHKPASETHRYYSFSSTVWTSRVCMWGNSLLTNITSLIGISATFYCASGRDAAGL